MSLVADTPSTSFTARRANLMATLRTLPLLPTAIIVVLLVMAVFAPLLTPWSPTEQSLIERLRPPAWVARGSWAHPLGTDLFGRDILARVIYGARVSLFVGIFAVIGSVVPATVIGVLSAYFGGAFDYLVQRVVDAVQAIPGIILLIVIMTVLGVSLSHIVIALAIPAAISDSRVMRSATVQINSSEYVSAARALGATDLRIMFQHILPNIVSPIIVVASLGFGRFILAESTLSFLGYGIVPPAPSWGGMLAKEGQIGRAHV